MGNTLLNCFVWYFMCYGFTCDGMFKLLSMQCDVHVFIYDGFHLPVTETASTFAMYSTV